MEKAPKLHRLATWLFVCATTSILAIVLGFVLIGKESEPPKPSAPHSPIKSGTPVSLGGHLRCLPHKDSTGDVTLECAIGMEADDGKYYALRNNKNEVLFDIPFDKHVTVHGRLSTDYESVYQTSGVIDVEKIVQE